MRIGKNTADTGPSSTKRVPAEKTAEAVEASEQPQLRGFWECAPSGETVSGADRHALQ